MVRHWENSQFNQKSISPLYPKDEKLSDSMWFYFGHTGYTFSGWKPCCQAEPGSGQDIIKAVLFKKGHNMLELISNLLMNAGEIWEK